MVLAVACGGWLVAGAMPVAVTTVTEAGLPPAAILGTGVSLLVARFAAEPSGWRGLGFVALGGASAYGTIYVLKWLAPESRPLLLPSLLSLVAAILIHLAFNQSYGVWFRRVLAVATLAVVAKPALLVACVGLGVSLCCAAVGCLTAAEGSRGRGFVLGGLFGLGGCALLAVVVPLATGYWFLETHYYQVEAPVRHLFLPLFTLCVAVAHAYAQRKKAERLDRLDRVLASLNVVPMGVGMMFILWVFLR